MNKSVKLAEEELIFSSENFIQNIKYLKEDYDNDIEPRKYSVEVEGRDVTVIVLNQMTVTSMVGSFRNLVHFRLIINWDEDVILASPSSNKSLFTDDLALEDYVNKIANNIMSNRDQIGDYGNKVHKAIKNFQLWNFYNYKILLDL